MSRVSLRARAAAIREAIDRADPQGARLRALGPADRDAYARWCADCERLSAHAVREGGEAEPYARFLAGTLTPPPMGARLTRALGLADVPTITADMSTADATRLWHIFAIGE